VHGTPPRLRLIGGTVSRRRILDPARDANAGAYKLAN
jgi:hypothetical protein